MNESNLDTQWNLIIVRDPLALPGKTIYKVLELLKNIVNYKFVILNDINGAYSDPLFEEEGEILEIKTILPALLDVKQFQWGDFFLFKKSPKHWKQIEDFAIYPDVIIQTDTTIRAVDQTYVYVYTQYSEAIVILKNNFTVESVKTDLLENLEFPY